MSDQNDGAEPVASGHEPQPSVFVWFSGVLFIGVFLCGSRHTLSVLLNPSADVSPQCAEVAFGRRVPRSKSDERASPLHYFGPNGDGRDSVVEAHGISGACRRAVVVEQHQLSRANAIAWLFSVFRGVIHRVADFGC